MTANHSGFTKKRLLRRAIRTRALSFDALEERRLMAGLDVFIFDDADGSRGFDSIREGAIAERAVYIDLNRDGVYSASEPWALSNARGFASFPELDPGSYSIRLLGSNKSVSQTFPTQAAEQGAWADGLGITKVLVADANGTAWGISGNSLSLVKPQANQTLKSIRFGNAVVIDAVLKPNADGDFTGYVLTQNQDRLQVLWQVSTAGIGSKRAVNIDVTSASQLVLVGDKVLMVHGATTKQISVFNFSNASNGIELANFGVGELPPTAMVKASGSDSFFVLSTVANGPGFGASSTSKLSLYRLQAGTAERVGERVFEGSITAWESSPDGSRVAVAARDGVAILEATAFLPTQKMLSGATGPVAFDPVRQLLFAGSTHTNATVTAWNTSAWTSEFSVAVSESRSLSNPDTKIHLDATGSKLLLSQNGSLYEHNIAVASAATVFLSTNDRKQVHFGVKSTGVNQKPTLGKLDPWTVDEDGQLLFAPERIQSKVSDPDGDSIVYLVRSAPTNGLLAWKQDATGFYRPAANWNGQDAFAIQAYDGQDWSAIQSVAIDVQPINDLPSEIEFSDELVSENTSLQSALSRFNVIDPDQDATYDFGVDDARFEITDGILRLKSGSINFEEESVIRLTVTAFDRIRTQDSIARRVALRVRDTNDAPTGILSPTRIAVSELVENLQLGQLSVIDQDANESYQWSTSDSRFEINSGAIQLKPGVSLNFESEPTIELTVRALDSRGEFSIERQITIDVIDQDEEPTELLIESAYSVLENEPGIDVAHVSVLDQDQGEQYSFAINDSRFEITNSGVVRLRPGVSVSYVDPGFIDLTIFATSLRSGSRISGSLRLVIERDPTPHHNDKNPYDVDGDGELTPLDPLLIINHINNKGIGPIEEPAEGEGPVPDLDVDGDGQVTPIDILILINKLNQQSNEEIRRDFGKAEGESVGPAIQPPVTSLATARDASLASYLSDLNDEIGPKRLHRALRR